MAERIFSEAVVLPDGRKVRVLAYDDHSVRFRLDGTPYVLEEAFLSGGRQDHAIIKLAPRGVPADDAHGEADPFTQLEASLNDLLGRLDRVPDAGRGRIIRRHQRDGIRMAIVLVQGLIEQARRMQDEPDDDGAAGESPPA